MPQPALGLGHTTSLPASGNRLYSTLNRCSERRILQLRELEDLTAMRRDLCGDRP